MQNAVPTQIRLAEHGLAIEGVLVNCYGYFEGGVDLIVNI
jgi:hypothetical protein